MFLLSRIESISHLRLHETHTTTRNTTNIDETTSFAPSRIPESHGSANGSSESKSESQSKSKSESQSKSKSKSQLKP
jgi:hypothetical protein